MFFQKSVPEVVTWLMHNNQHSQHPNKLKKQPETQKQFSQWMAGNVSVQTKRNTVDK